MLLRWILHKDAASLCKPHPLKRAAAADKIRLINLVTERRGGGSRMIGAARR